MNDSSGLPPSILNLGPNIVGYRSLLLPNNVDRLNITSFAQSQLKWAAQQTAWGQTNCSNQKRELSVVTSSNQTSWPIGEIQRTAKQAREVELPQVVNAKRNRLEPLPTAKELQQVDHTKFLSMQQAFSSANGSASGRYSYEIICNSLNNAMVGQTMPERAGCFVDALDKRLWDSLFRCNGFKTSIGQQTFENITLFFKGQIETYHGRTYFVSMCEHMDTLYKEDKMAFSSFIEISGLRKILSNVTDLMWIALIKRNTTLFKRCQLSRDEEQFFKGQDLNSQKQIRGMLSPDYDQNTLKRLRNEERQPYSPQYDMQIAIEKSFLRPELDIYFCIGAEDGGRLKELADALQDPQLQGFYSQHVILAQDIPDEGPVLSSSNLAPLTRKRHITTLHSRDVNNRKKQPKNAKRQALKQTVKKPAHEEIFAVLNKQIGMNRFSARDQVLNHFKPSLWDSLVQNNGFSVDRSRRTLADITDFFLTRTEQECVKSYFVSMYNYMEALYKSDKEAYSTCIARLGLQGRQQNMRDIMSITFIKRNTTFSIGDTTDSTQDPKDRIAVDFFQGKDLNSKNQIRGVLSSDYHPDVLTLILDGELSTGTNPYTAQIKVETGFVQYCRKKKWAAKFVVKDQEAKNLLKQVASGIKSEFLKQFYRSRITVQQSMTNLSK